MRQSRCSFASASVLRATRAPDAHVVQLGLHRAETGLDVAQTLAVRELGEGQTQELVEAREAVDLILAVVAGHAAAELGQRQEEVHQLREDGASGMNGTRKFKSILRMTSTNPRYVQQLRG